MWYNAVRRIEIVSDKFDEETNMVLQIGDLAPDFSLKTHLGQTVRLSDLRGKQNVVLAFFPLAWTPV
jgi:hypothetical protein